MGIFRNDAAIVRLAGAMVLEQNDQRNVNRRCIQLGGLQILFTAPTRLNAATQCNARISALSWLCAFTKRWETTA